MRSTKYVSWWSARPSAIVKTLRRTLQTALLEAGLKVRSMSRAQREKQQLARIGREFEAVLEGGEVVEPPTTAAKNAGAKKSVKSPGEQKKPR